jgi:hypothetical protein
MKPTFRSIWQSTVIAASLAAVWSADAPADAATFHFLGGVQDNYVPPTEPASPSASLQTFIGASSYRQYDEAGANEWFADSFLDCPMCIAGAELEIGLRPETIVSSGGATNDTIRMNFTNNLGQQVGPYWLKNVGFPAGQQSVLPQDWGTQNYPNGVVLNLNLAALPLGNNNSNGSSSNLVPALRQRKFLNVDVQDDTAIDYIDLTITTGLAGDIDGDGCVDAQDLGLLVTYFNQAVPAGVGDPNGDGFFNVADLQLLQADFGRCCPEAGSCVLLLAGCLGMAAVGRRRAAG